MDGSTQKVVPGGLRVVCEKLPLPQSCVGLYIPLPLCGVSPRHLASLRDVCSSTPVQVTATRDILALTHLSVPANSRAAFGCISDLIRRGPLALPAAHSVSVSKQRESPLSDPDTVITELVNCAAYGRNTQRGAFSAASEDIRNISAQEKLSNAASALKSIRSCPASDAVVVATGPDAHVVASCAERELGTIFANKKDENVSLKGATKYRGGKCLVSAEKWKPQLTGNRAHLAHLALCFDSPLKLGASTGKAGSRDLYSLLVASAVLGGGSSFSQGGPGKGMESRLYRDVLSQPWMESARVVAEYGRNGGVFGIAGACEPSMAGKMVISFAEQLVLLAAEPLKDEELERGRNAALSGIALATEGCNGLCDDAGSQLVLRGHWDRPKDIARHIRDVTSSDVQSVVRRALLSRPTLAGVVPDANRRGVRPMSILSKQINMLLAFFQVRASVMKQNTKPVK